MAWKSRRTCLWLALAITALAGCCLGEYLTGTGSIPLQVLRITGYSICLRAGVTSPVESALSSQNQNSAGAALKALELTPASTICDSMLVSFLNLKTDSSIIPLIALRNCPPSDLLVQSVATRYLEVMKPRPQHGKLPWPESGIALWAPSVLRHLVAASVRDQVQLDLKTQALVHQALALGKTTSYMEQ